MGIEKSDFVSANLQCVLGLVADLSKGKREMADAGAAQNGLWWSPFISFF